jgi:diguanylate cyclase (GGDEF)-like protein
MSCWQEGCDNAVLTAVKGFAKTTWKHLSSISETARLEYLLLLAEQRLGRKEFIVRIGSFGATAHLAPLGDVAAIPVAMYTDSDTFITLSDDYYWVWQPFKINGACEAILVVLVPYELGKKGAEQVAEQIANTSKLAPCFGESCSEEDGVCHNSKLTHLPGKYRLSQSLYQSVSLKSSCCILHIDLDDFHVYNDRHGRAAGDDFIRQIAAHIPKALGKECVFDLFHCGSDEFFVVLKDASESDGIELALRIKAHISDHFDGACCSVGVHAPQCCTKADVDEILDMTRKATSVAKETGRDSVACVSDLVSRRAILVQVTNAIEQGTIAYHYQTVLDIKTQEPLYRESLIRISSSNGDQPPSPAQFIPILETSSIISVVDKYTLDQAIAMIAIHEGIGTPIVIGINVSGKTLERPDWVRYLEKRLLETGINPNHLVLEMTETWMRRHSSVASHSVAKIKELGCHFALDDFGVGAHSYQDMLTLPVDYVKIDASLISRMAANKASFRIVEHITEAASSLGIEVIAEGVETLETLQALEAANIRFAQGFYWGRPSSNILHGSIGIPSRNP